MQRPSVNYLIDMATLLAMVAIACTGLIMRFALPPGSGRGGQELWGFGRHEWGSVHFWTTAVVAGLLAIHVMLHWAWVCTVTARLAHPRARVNPPTAAARRRFGALFLTILTLLLVGFTLVARASVRGVATGGEALGGAGEPLHQGRGRAP